MKHISKDTDNDVIKLIEAIVLHPKARDVLINTFIKQASILEKRELGERSNDQLRSLFTSDSFLKQFVGPFKKIFTDEEISRLLEIYQSSVMKKLLEHTNDLFDPLYNAMRKQVEMI